MYHCHVQFYFIGMQPGELHTIQEMPPRKGFTHGFSAGEAPDAATAENPWVNPLRGGIS